MPVWGSMYFQEGVSPVMEQLVFFHDHTMTVMLVVMVVVGYLLFSAVFGVVYDRGLREGQGVESVWTILPAFVLLLIAFPSLRLLYIMEEGDSSDLTVSVIGHQWYWSYEVPGLGDEGLDSYMDGHSDFRLMGADNSLVLPYLTSIRAMITSEDVIHSWTVPGAGVSADAVPGRLNQVNLWFNRGGWYVGQCSEICGANHSFMPIFIKVVSREDFLSYIV